jgi:hypothetical protein
VKWLYYWKEYYRFNVDSIKIPKSFFIEIR